MSYQDFNATAPAGNGVDSRGTAGIPGKDDERKLFVGALTRQTTEQELRGYFSKYGEIESVTLKIDPATGQSRGFAFIVFKDASVIEKVLSSNHYINKRKVDPKHVTKKAQNGKIFVGGLNTEMSDEDIRNHFSQFGTVVEVQSPFDKVKNQRKGFCFVTFESKEVMFQVLKTPRQIIKGKEVEVKKVKVNPETMAPGGRVGGAPASGWGANQSFAGGYAPEYPPPYGAPQYNNYGEYGGTSYNEYSNYGYPNAGPPHPFSAKTRGGGRQFQRHQPY